VYEKAGVVWIPTSDPGDPNSTKIIPVDATTLRVIQQPEVDLGVIATWLVTGFDSLWYGSGTTVYRLSLDAFAN
jgi:hypothetical protein